MNSIQFNSLISTINSALLESNITKIQEIGCDLAFGKDHAMQIRDTPIISVENLLINLSDASPKNFLINYDEYIKWSENVSVSLQKPLNIFYIDPENCVLLAQLTLEINIGNPGFGIIRIKVI